MNKNTPSLALVIPAYNEGPSLVPNFLEIRRILAEDGIPCRFHFVDDGSRDNTWSQLCQLAADYPEVSAVRFSRNFGKEIALSAGIDSIDADLYLTLDADLQHPPERIKDMLALMQREQANIVQGVKRSRGKESAHHRFLAESFYKTLHAITGLDLDNSSDFKLMDRQVVDALRGFHERNLFFRGLVDWVGFKTVTYPFDVAERSGGTTHFSTRRLIALALNAILSHTGKPLYLTLVSGTAFLVFALILGLQTLYNYFSGQAVSGFSTVILLLLLTGSLILISLGIIGVYLSRIYEEIKGRPRYIIAERRSQEH